jgi:hypothetical protein
MNIEQTAIPAYWILFKSRTEKNAQEQGTPVELNIELLIGLDQIIEL